MSSFNHIGDKSAQIASSFVQPTDLLEKGKAAQPIGTIKEMGGRPYIKTAQGWKYHGKGTGTKAQEHAAGASSKEPASFKEGDKIQFHTGDKKWGEGKIITDYPSGSKYSNGMIINTPSYEVHSMSGTSHLIPKNMVKEGKGIEKIEEKKETFKLSELKEQAKKEGLFFSNEDKKSQTANEKEGFRTSFKNETGARTDVFVFVPNEDAVEFRVETKVHIPEGNEGIERIKIREKWFPIDQYDSFVADLKERVENASKPITHAEIYAIPKTIDKAKIKTKR